MSNDPHMAAVATYVDQVVDKVKAGQLAQADALAALAADVLGLSLQDHVDPDTADALLGMAQEFARQRYAIVNAAAAEIPDDPSGLEG